MVIFPICHRYPVIYIIDPLQWKLPHQRWTVDPPGSECQKAPYFATFGPCRAAWAPKEARPAEGVFHGAGLIYIYIYTIYILYIYINIGKPKVGFHMPWFIRPAISGEGVEGCFFGMFFWEEVIRRPLDLRKVYLLRCHLKSPEWLACSKMRGCWVLLHHTLNIGYVMFKSISKRKGKGIKMKDDGLLVMTASPFFWPISAVHIIHHAGDGPETQDCGENHAAVLDIFWVVVSGFIFFWFSPLFGEYSHFDEYFFKGVEPPNYSLSGVQIFWVVLLWIWKHVVAALSCLHFLGQCCSMMPFMSRQYSRSLTFFFTFFPERRKTAKLRQRAGGAKTHL